MQRFYSFFFILIQITWGFPQTLLGLFLFLRHRTEKHDCFHAGIRTFWKRNDGVSLGLFFFVPVSEPSLSAHEYGHCLQSLLLGPLYPFLIGLPSLLWARLPCFQKLRQRKMIPYEAFYTERWAEWMAGRVRFD